MRLSITCFAQQDASAVGDAFNSWLPSICCAEGCDRPSVYKLRGRVPPKGRADPNEDDWLFFEIGLTLCEEHERTQLASDLVGLPDVRRHIRELVRTVGGTQPDMKAVEIAMIPFAIGTA
jgi:hypothetical protein